MRKLDTAEGFLIHGTVNVRKQCITDLPTVCIFDTVQNRKLASLLRLQIISAMGISREDHNAGIILHLLNNVGDNGRSVGTAETAGRKIVLHVNDDQIFHKFNAS